MLRAMAWRLLVEVEEELPEDGTVALRQARTAPYCQHFMK
jgi:hypothetical protein